MSAVLKKTRLFSLDPALAPVDGSWSPWGPWSACTGTGCGAAAGSRERRRVCDKPAPQHGGADCEGSRTERQTCDLKPCELRKATAWTPWVQIPSKQYFVKPYDYDYILSLKYCW